jgi:CP family cyanate transporter-like MFS transporter
VYTERGWGDTEAGALVAVLNAFALVTGVTTALVGDRAPRRTVLRLAAGVAVVGSVAIAADVAGAWAWAALLGASAGMLFTIVMTLPLDAAGSRTEIAAMTTLMLGVGYSISAFAPVVLGAVRDASGSFTAALALLACDSFALLVVTLRMPARIREMSENPVVRRSPRRPGGGKEIR